MIARSGDLVFGLIGDLDSRCRGPAEDVGRGGSFERIADAELGRGSVFAGADHVVGASSASAPACFQLDRAKVTVLHILQRGFGEESRAAHEALIVHHNPADCQRWAQEKRNPYSQGDYYPAAPSLPLAIEPAEDSEADSSQDGTHRYP